MYKRNYNNSPFYKTTKWEKVSAAYLQSQNYICERCGKAARICHHKIWLNGRNINNPAITLNFDNLEALCLECHNAEHGAKHSVLLFDDSGNISGIKENQEIKNFQETKNAIEAMLQSLKG